MATSPQPKYILFPSSSTGSSTSGAARGKKSGRPNGWTASRQRKLARLYLYSTLPTKDISRVLKDEEAKWAPGPDSTTKTVNSLLDKEPRWLRPKTREETEQRMARLTESRTERKRRRNQHAPPELPKPNLPQDPKPHTFKTILSTEFSETPLQDIFANGARPEPEIIPEASCTSLNFSRPRKSVFDNTLQDEFTHPPTTDQLSSTGSLDIPGTPRPASLLGGQTQRASTYLSISSLKNRLSQYSSNQLKDIKRLIKVYSISGSSAATTIGPNYPASINSKYESTICDSTATPTTAAQRKGRARLILPSSILLLDEHLLRQGFCVPGMKPHDSKTCWCLEELNPTHQLWVHKDGFLNEELGQLLDYLPESSLDFRDAFGNTVLHMLAARGAGWHLIFKALKKGVDGNFKNAAGQSFLHVFPRKTIYSLAEDCTVLMALLQGLSRFNINFYSYDLFGRSFYHMLTYGFTKVNRQSFWVSFWVLDFLKVQLKSSRDAFGWTANFESLDRKGFDSINSDLDESETFIVAGYRKLIRQNKIGQPTSVNTERAQNFILEAYRECTPEATVHDSSVFPDRDFIQQHECIIRTAHIAIQNPHVEDYQGRNGLQCLAEALLPLDKKRKRDQDDTESPSAGITLLFNLTQTLLGAGVDANHYDKAGNTVLMSFVKHQNDGEDDKILAALFQSLLRHPYNMANVHRRNREGESALHVAIRLGRKVATRILLVNGANVHARNSEGKGVLAVGEMHYFRARGDPRLYASIHSCMALAADFGAVASPTLVQEWTMRDEDLYKV